MTRYEPLTGRFRSDVSIGLLAGIGMEIALGPIRGGVWIQFGVVAEFHVSDGGTGSATIGIMLLIRGEAELLGFISISIELLLEARYSQGGRMTGRGRLRLRIKICWFISIDISVTVEHQVSDGRPDGPRGLRETETPAERYVRRFD